MVAIVRPPIRRSSLREKMDDDNEFHIRHIFAPPPPQKKVVYNKG